MAEMHVDEQEHYPAERICLGDVTVLVLPDTNVLEPGVPSAKGDRDPRGTPNPDIITRWVNWMNDGASDGHKDKVNYCVFCKNNNEDKGVYKTHRLKDQLGLVICPRLRSFVCRKCGASGPFTHTDKHCLMKSVLPIGHGRRPSSTRPRRMAPLSWRRTRSFTG